MYTRDLSAPFHFGTSCRTSRGEMTPPYWGGVPVGDDFVIASMYIRGPSAGSGRQTLARAFVPVGSVIQLAIVGADVSANRVILERSEESCNCKGELFLNNL
jgi:hypothetical protein